MSQAGLFTLRCPSCGAKVLISSEEELFTCIYCDTELAVKRIEGVISLTPVVEELGEAKAEPDKTASGLEIQRLTARGAEPGRTASEIEIQRLTAKIRELEDRRIEQRGHYDRQIAGWGGILGILGTYAVWFLGLRFLGGFSWLVMLLGLIAFLAIFGWIYQNRKRKLETSQRRLEAEIRELRDEVKRRR